MNNDEDNFLGLLTIIGFAIGVQNLQENVSQSQMQNTVKEAVSEIHRHLEMQDDKIDKIIKILEEKGGL